MSVGRFFRRLFVAIGMITILIVMFLLFAAPGFAVDYTGNTAFYWLWAAVPFCEVGCGFILWKAFIEFNII